MQSFPSKDFNRSKFTSHISSFGSGQAHTMLAEIYGWFTEGFDTADLKGW